MEDLGSKKSNKIPVYIVEYHNDALPFVFRAVGSKRLPTENVKFVHLDSHPDLLISRDMRADLVYNKEDLFESLSIENWIMPACYAGIFTDLVWIKPVWANQIDEGRKTFRVGENRSGKLKLDCAENYFLTDCCYEMDLSNAKEVNLEVVTLGKGVINENDDFKTISDTINGCVKENDFYVLDIDLDFFSTSNPFKSLYREIDLYEKLKEIYKFDWPKTKNPSEIQSATLRRDRQIKELESYFKHLQETKKLPEIDHPTDTYTKIDSLLKELLEIFSADKIDFELIHDMGCTIDETELPDHVSTDDELNIMLEAFRQFLNVLRRPPTLITISRSTIDDYTPEEDVEFIQSKVLDCLKSKFDCDDAVLKYLEDVNG